MDDSKLPPYLQRPISLSKFDESLDELDFKSEVLGDHGREVEQDYGEFSKETLLSCLTKRQRLVAELLFDGYKRKEIAKDHLHVVMQAVHQIVPRIRKRLIKRADELGLDEKRLYGFFKYYESE